MAAVNTSGSQTATVSTEHTLATVTSAGVFQLAVDLAAMTDGTTPDITRIRIYSKARSADTERLVEVYEFIGSQGKPLFFTIPLIQAVSNYRVTLQQIQGTGRAYPWAVLEA